MTKHEKNEKVLTASDDDSTDYFLGERQNLNTTQSDIDLRDVIGEVDEIVVMNDEAHHIHDSSLAWYKAIETLHLHMLQKNSKVSMQIDVTATPKHQKTGAIFANDDKIIEKGRKYLKHSAGNFYINDKPTGAVVGQQPFGGSRASGTNDKAGAPANLLRWTSQRTVKQTFNTPTNYRYPFMEKK